jgi:hypothetical protein
LLPVPLALSSAAQILGGFAMIRLKALAIALLFCVLLLPSTPAYAQIEYGGEKIIKLADLPDTAEFQTPEGGYIDVGAIYKQFKILWLPLHNYEIRMVGYTGENGTYLELAEAELRAAAAAAGVTLPEGVNLPFWDAWGGKLAFGGVILLIVLIVVIAGRRKRSPQA